MPYIDEEGRNLGDWVPNFYEGLRYRHNITGDWIVHRNGTWASMESPSVADAQFQQQVQNWSNAGDLMPQSPKEPEEPDEMPAKLRLVNEYKIGSDPEFIPLGPKGGHISLQSILPHLGQVGWDHNGRIAELRPPASRHALTHVKAIARLLNSDAVKPIRDYKWRAGAAYKYPGSGTHESLGGHIHFDFPYARRGEKLPALDRLTLQLEQTDVLPRSECETRREGHFGHWGDCRPAGRANNPRLEYRTPASWLFSPRTALYCLTTYKLALADPMFTLETLSDDGSAAELRRFIEAFRNKDDDADFILERFLEHGGLRTIKGNPDADMRTAWSGTLF